MLRNSKSRYANRRQQTSSNVWTVIVWVLVLTGFGWIGAWSDANAQEPSGATRHAFTISDVAVPEGYVLVLSEYATSPTHSEIIANLGMLVDTSTIVSDITAGFYPSPNHTSITPNQFDLLVGGTPPIRMDNVWINGWICINNLVVLKWSGTEHVSNESVPMVADYHPRPDELLAGTLLIQLDDDPPEVIQEFDFYVLEPVQTPSPFNAEVTITAYPLASPLDLGEDTLVVNGFIFNQAGDFVGLVVPSKYGLFFMPFPDMSTVRYPESTDLNPLLSCVAGGGSVYLVSKK